MSLIIADHLAKTFEDGSVAVREATFTVAAGETLSILGANGAGKSTTIHLLLGNIPPTTGSSSIAGISMQERPLEAKKHLGYVSENVLLYGALTAEQNIRFFSRLSGKDVSREQLDLSLERVGLASAAKRRVDTFSKGMRQRCGIAIALAKDPEALIMDEPTTGLDPAGVDELNDLILHLREEGKAILLVTHDLFRSQEISDRIIVMRDGRLADPIPSASIRDVRELYFEVAGRSAAVGGV